MFFSQEGGVAFLYHPCSDVKEIKKLRKVAEMCLRKYILTPSDNLPKDMVCIHYKFITKSAKLIFRPLILKAKKFWRLFNLMDLTV